MGNAYSPRAVRPSAQACQALSTSLRDTLKSIQDLKRSGVTKFPEEDVQLARKIWLAMIVANDEAISEASKSKKSYNFIASSSTHRSSFSSETGSTIQLVMPSTGSSKGLNVVTPITDPATSASDPPGYVNNNTQQVIANNKRNRPIASPNVSRKGVFRKMESNDDPFDEDGTAAQDLEKIAEQAKTQNGLPCVPSVFITSPTLVGGPIQKKPSQSDLMQPSFSTSLMDDDDWKNNSMDGNVESRRSSMASIADLISQSPVHLNQVAASPHLYHTLVQSLYTADAALDLAADLSSSSTLNFDETISLITTKALKILECEACRVYTVNKGKDKLHVYKVVTSNKSIYISINEGVPGNVYATQTAIILDSSQSDFKWQNNLESIRYLDSITGVSTNNVMAVPMMNKGVLVGILEAVNRKQRPFASQDLHLAQSYCCFAAMCVSNAQMYEEVNLQRERQNALLEIAKALGASLDKDRMMAHIMQTARSLVNADRCSLFLVDEPSKQLVVRFTEDGPETRLPIGAGIAGYVATTSQHVNIPDAYADSRFNAEVDRKTGYRTHNILCMPIKDETSVVAVAQLINKHKGTAPFDSADQELFSAFAAFAGLSLRNALLYHGMVRAKEETELLLETVTRLSTNDMRDMDSVSLQVMERARQLLQAEKCLLYIVNTQTNELVARFETDDGSKQEVRQTMSQGIPGYVAKTGEIVNIKDAYKDKRFLKDFDHRFNYHTKAVLCMPLYYGNEVIAVAELINKCKDSNSSTEYFSNDDVKMFKAFSNSAGVALRNSMLYRNMKKAQQETEHLLQTVDRLSAVDIQDFDKVASEIMDTARILLDADRCSLFLVDHEKQELAVRFSANSPEVRLPINAGIAGHVATTGTTLNIPNAYEDVRFNKQVDIQTGYKTDTILCMPVAYESSIVAVAQLINKKDGIFQKEDELLFKAFSSFAAVSLRNAKMYRDKVRANRRTELLLETADAMNSTSIDDMSNLIQRISDGAQNIALCQYCIVYRVVLETQELIATGGSGKVTRYSLSRGIAGEVARSGKIINAFPANKHEMYDVEVDGMKDNETKTILSLPAFFQGNVVGVIQLSNKMNGAFTEEDERTLKAFATFAGISIGRTHLFTSLANAAKASMQLQFQRTGLTRALNSLSPRSPTKLIPKTNSETNLPHVNDESKRMVMTSKFNIFDYWLTTEQYPMLVPLSVHIFQELKYLDEFSIPQTIFIRFVKEVSKKYRRVPYHNFAHAFDCVQTLVQFVQNPEIHKYLTKLDTFILLVAGLCHDIDHMGLSNSFLYKADSPYGILSHKAGAKSALEVHHCNVTIGILDNDATNIFSSLGTDNNQWAWRTLIDAILATDMASDAEHCGEFATLMMEHLFQFSNPDHRCVVLKILLKLADISNVTKPFEISKRWGQQITHEFQSTGTVDDKLDDVPVTALAKAQCGFIDNVGRPMYELAASCLPFVQPMLDQLETNYELWKSILSPTNS